MSRTYSKELLEEYEAKKYEYNSKKMTEYEALQEQRKLERQIRRWKREQNALAAAGLDTSEATAKVREWNGKHKDFLEQTGLKADGTRLVAYREILKKGLFSGKIGDTDDGNNSVIDNVFSMDYANKKGINLLLRLFAKDNLDSIIEHALVFSPSGNAYEISGFGANVNIELAGLDELKNAIVIHNHSREYGMSGDCFSIDDFKGFFKYGLKELYCQMMMEFLL